MISLLLITAASAADLTVLGACPGPMSLEITGLTPFGTFNVISSNGFGHYNVPAGLCAGIDSNLSPNGYKYRASGVADAYGNGFMAFSPGGKACGAKLAIMDEGSCTMSATRFLTEGHANHLATDFSPTDFHGQWCDGDAPINYMYVGETDFDTCDSLANATGTQHYVGDFTSHLLGWIGDQDAANAAASSGSWPTEAIVARTDLRSCQIGQVEHRTEPTVNPPENLFTDVAGRNWHYWNVAGQTHSQALSLADMKGARIINPNSVGLVGLARMTTPTHWCHAGAQFNGGSSCNSDNVCDFTIGFYE